MPDFLIRILRDLGELALPVAIFGLVSSAISWMFASPALDRNSKLLTFAFAILGGVSGVIAGSSFESLVGTLITGMLGIVSAILAYIFTTTAETDTVAKKAIPFIVILLLSNTLLGLSIGKNWKWKWENYGTEMAEYHAKFQQLWVPINREYQTEVLRRCLTQNTNYVNAKQNCRYDLLFPQ